MLWITIVCAAIFAVNKYFEYSYKFGKGIFPGTDIFYSIYFAATDIPNKKLEQAAIKSYEKAFSAPIWVAT